jgi:hypothetical protein
MTTYGMIALNRRLVLSITRAPRKVTALHTGHSIHTFALVKTRAVYSNRDETSIMRTSLNPSSSKRDTLATARQAVGRLLRKSSGNAKS